MPWDPDQYHKFQSERSAPFADLVALIEPHEGMRVIDLGCGTGELTSRLADMLPGCEVVGLDSSEEMLERAAEFTRPGLRFELGSIEAVVGKWDLIFSHAALQWVNDHDTLLPHLLSLLEPEGQIAVQVPSNHGHPSQVFLREIARQEPFEEALGGWERHSPVLSIDAYARLLYFHKCTDITVLEKVYPHVLADVESLADWVRGTVLIPYFDRLPDVLQQPFMDRYLQRLRRCWPAGPIFYGFRRTLFAATRSTAQLLQT